MRNHSFPQVFSFWLKFSQSLYTHYRHTAPNRLFVRLDTFTRIDLLFIFDLKIENTFTVIYVELVRIILHQLALKIDWAH